MRTMSKGNQEEDEYEDDEFGSRKEGPSSNTNISNNKDAKNDDKASATRSKHSVTEQRRRSKINERFQTLRDLVPHSDQKRDTASFLLEVINYVQYLQEKVQKFEGSYQGWNSEPSKLIPWRHNHWRAQNYVGHPQAAKNGPGSAFPGNLDENNIALSPSILTSSQNPVQPNPCRDEGGNKGIPLPIPTSASVAVPGRTDGVLADPLQLPVPDSQSTQCPTTSEAPNQQDDLAIEGGTISITSAYSQGLLNTVAQALQNAGLDLSQASISVQIDLGKRANRALSAGASVSKDYEHPRSSNLQLSHHRDTSSGEDPDQALKRLKT